MAFVEVQVTFKFFQYNVTALRLLVINIKETNR